MKFRGGGEQGFTIIELLITVTVVAILLALAAPSWSNFIQKRQISSTAEQLGGFLVSAQSEAVKRFEPVTVTFNRTGNTNWCVGMTMGTATCDCTAGVSNPAAVGECHIDGAGRILDSTVSDSVLLTAADSSGDATFTYDRLRGLLENNDQASFAFQTENANYALTMDVTPTGRVSICTDASKELKGYQTCPTP